MRIPRNNSGMTLIEMVVSIGILSMVSASLLAVAVHGLRAYSAGTSQQVALNSATLGLNKLSLEIRDGRSAVAQGNVLTVTYPALLSDPKTGEQAYDINANSAVTRSYYVEDGNLVRSVNGSVSIVVRGISSVQFIASLGSVRITLVGSFQAGSVGSTQSVAGMVALRNYRG